MLAWFSYELQRMCFTYYRSFLLLHKSGRDWRCICKRLTYILRSICRPNHRNLLANLLNCHEFRRSQLRESCVSPESQGWYWERGLIHRLGPSLPGPPTMGLEFMHLISTRWSLLYVAGRHPKPPFFEWIWPSYVSWRVTAVKDCWRTRLDFFSGGWRTGLISQEDKEVPQKPPF